MVSGAQRVGTAIYDRAMSSPTWTVPPGETKIREQIHVAYGGNPQAGIRRSSSTPNILVYSDHEKAAANGYDFDGWDESQRVYYYTVEGKIGDQVMLRGNRAIAEHHADGTTLRLFVAVGSRPSSDTRIHRYVGQFSIDPDVPHGPVQITHAHAVADGLVDELADDVRELATCVSHGNRQFVASCCGPTNLPRRTSGREPCALP